MSLPEYIFPGAFVRLRDGTKARIYAVDGVGPNFIHGARLFGGDCWYHLTWSVEGRRFRGSTDQFDIIGPWVDKPDCSKLWPILSPWIKWVARDEGGEWFGYAEEPYRSGEVWRRGYASFIPAEYASFIPAEYAPVFTGDWKDSLCERPK